MGGRTSSSASAANDDQGARQRGSETASQTLLAAEADLGGESCLQSVAGAWKFIPWKFPRAGILRLQLYGTYIRLHSAVYSNTCSRDVLQY
eukprot:SAG25_NODE_5_length_29351_cov_43.404335_46_plen_91_part_00